MLTYADVCCVGEQLMKFAVERKRRLEEDRRGLVILQVYLLLVYEALSY
jgi:hypothetical protein